MSAQLEDTVDFANPDTVNAFIRASMAHTAQNVQVILHDKVIRVLRQLAESPSVGIYVYLKDLPCDDIDIVSAILTGILVSISEIEFTQIEMENFNSGCKTRISLREDLREEFISKLTDGCSIEETFGVGGPAIKSANKQG